MKSNLQVLVVDDDRTSAEEYAGLLAAATGLEVDCTDDPNEAIAVVRSGRVCVAVLDQRMPVSGTDLFMRLRAEDPQLRAILLTAEASDTEVGAALNLGFKRYLKKENLVRNLPMAVLHEYTEYQNYLLAVDVAASQPVIYRGKARWWSPTQIIYRLLAVHVLDDAHISEEDWQEVLTLQAGQTDRHKIGFTVENSVVVEKESSATLKSSLGLDDKKFSGLTSRLESELTKRIKESTTRKASAQSEVERTFQLPAEPGDVKVLHVRARRVQQAPVYRMMRVDLMGDCGCCNRSHVLPIIVYAATGAVALRHVDQMSDGKSVTISLGMTTARI
jgi:CheY-like chemotaxis protein